MMIWPNEYLSDAIEMGTTIQELKQFKEGMVDLG